MKKIILTTAFLILTVFTAVLFTSCSKKSKEGAGTVMFYVCVDCGFGHLSVKIDGQYVGSLDSYLLACDPYDGQTENVLNASPGLGSHTYEVTGQSGGNWSGSFTIDEKNQTKIKVDCAGGSSTGNDLPSNYDNQGAITVHSSNLQVCVRDWDLVDGDIINIIVNGNTIASNVELTASNKCWNISGLIPGNNWIGIKTISPGTTSAASPRVEINDGFTTQSFQILSYLNQPGGYVIKVVL